MKVAIQFVYTLISFNVKVNSFTCNAVKLVYILYFILLVTNEFCWLEMLKYKTTGFLHSTKLFFLMVEKIESKHQNNNNKLLIEECNNKF